MRGARVALRHVNPADYEALHRIESDPATLSTWRYRDQLPALEDYEPALWRQTHTILVIERLVDASLAGYAQLYDVDLAAGIGWFSVYGAPDQRGWGAAMEGLMLFCDWVFENTSLRWLYAHSLEHNFGAFASSVRRGETVDLGVLRERLVIDGELTDVHVLGVERERWLAAPSRLRLLALRDRRAASEG